MTIERVLSMQSHVVSGYVGNKAAILPLQLAGIEADALNTVQFSNHTGYPTFKGERFAANMVSDIIKGLDANSLAKYDALLVGYIGSAEMLNCVRNVHESLKSKNENLKMLIDPVMGDETRGLYVNESLPPLYADMVKLADIITPNQFEAEMLSKIKIKSLDDAKNAAEKLAKDTSYVIITSCELENDKNNLHLVAHGPKGTLHIPFSKLDGHFTGTGDLFASLLLSRWSSAASWQDAVKIALTIMQKVLQRSAKALKDGISTSDKLQTLRSSELKLVQSIDDLRSNECLY